jgi:hypothetical protein
MYASGRCIYTQAPTGSRKRTHLPAVGVYRSVYARRRQRARVHAPGSRIRGWVGYVYLAFTSVYARAVVRIRTLGVRYTR